MITVVAGLSAGNPGDLLGELLTKLKNSCGAGGTIQKIEPTKAAPHETRQIELQGDHLCLLYTSPSPRDQRGSRMPSSA